MLRNISVRSAIASFMILAFVIIDILVFLLSASLPVLFTLNIAWAIIFICLWSYMTFYLVKPINEVKKNIDEISSGNLSVHVVEFGNNCAGRLIPGINKLSSEITNLVLDIRNSSQSAKSLSDNLANQSASLSVKTEQQSAMLIETAASMEQISVGTRNNAENTRQLSEITVSAHASANHGSDLMHKLTSNMTSISECANKMTEIISIIDNIAFQTNILALNAAVEAARAGEHGKGFSVVAGEVRNLAHKSSESAKSIKSLIEITNENVTQGANLVAEAEKNMKDIVAGSGNIETLMEHIFISTAEQEKGIHQITIALSELEKVTQSNVSVVEELAGSSDTLNQQVAELQKKTSKLRLGDGNDHKEFQAVIRPIVPTRVKLSTEDEGHWQTF
ncbi:methyl-accepting chemotaxis protein [Citrobacter sp. JGM124]|uniref:methyl-accepting chemotaxis protein n=1 Tax=Citrobacter sp. JGM124 TaxID=2799789 RepID=UPI001BA4ACCA|nr:methyl-accepting chemotaxis protein [Citrobacter sp. JGM124]MBS0849408.1 chemoreceptor protein [Citrobacter sp. JGM124]